MLVRLKKGDWVDGYEEKVRFTHSSHSGTLYPGFHTWLSVGEAKLGFLLNPLFFKSPGKYVLERVSQVSRRRVMAVAEVQ
jgi:hypothetical protein